MATKGCTKSEEIKYKMEMWKRNSSPGSQPFSYRKPRKNMLKTNLFLWVLFRCIFIAAFYFLVIFSQETWLLAYNIKNSVPIFRKELVKYDNKSDIRPFTLIKQTFSSQHNTFLKQPICLRFYQRKNEETLINIFSGCLNVNWRECWALLPILKYNDFLTHTDSADSLNWFQTDSADF